MAGLDDRPPMSAVEFRLLKELLLDWCGLLLREDLKYVAERRLWPRLEALGLDDFGEYYRYLKLDARGKDEMEQAIELLVPHETYFFREPTQLESFCNELLPMLQKRNERSRRLRFWSAGCASGEEPYTLSMLIDDSKLFEAWDVQLMGTDISRRVLTQARQAEFGATSLRATSPAQLAKYFDQSPTGRVRVKQHLRDRVSFGHLNLLDEQAASLLPQMDVIFCRNVLIYLEPKARSKVVTLFHHKLSPGGFLLLGHSESLLTLTTQFELVQLSGDLVYQRPDVAKK
jgi:chemotaxis protein methyltransferase CheR